MANERKPQEELCSVCLRNKRNKGLMCPDCYTIHKNESMKNIMDHSEVENQLDFAQRQTLENLEKCIEELKSRQEETRPFFSTAHEEVKRECRRAGIRFRKENQEEHTEFMALVHNRYKEIMKGAGQEEIYNKLEFLKNEIRVCKDALKWYEKLARNGQKTKKVAKNAQESIAAA